MRPINPVTLKTLDGQEREFLLSMGGIRRLKKRLGVVSFSEIMNQDAEAAGVPILFEAMLDKGALTEDQFADLLPADLEKVAKTVLLLIGVSLPDPNPTTASEPTPIQ